MEGNFLVRRGSFFRDKFTLFIVNFYIRIKIRLTNLILPLYYLITSSNSRYKLSDKRIDSNSPPIIVSLTSFPDRILKVWIVIESMLRQSRKPDLIVLWLYKDEFRKGGIPKRLMDLTKRGLEIRYADVNIYGHKKYYYSILAFPNSLIITIDDDIIYPVSLLSELFNAYVENENHIICILSRKIKTNGIQFLPYVHWPKVYEFEKDDNALLMLSGGGTLFPPNSLHSDFQDINELERLAPFADDLWLKVMSLRNSTKIVCVAGNVMRGLVPIIYHKNRRLMDNNVLNGGNDVVFKALLSKYKLGVSDFIK